MRRFIASAVVPIIAVGVYVGITASPALAPNPQAKRTIVLQSSLGVCAEIQLAPEFAVFLDLGPTSGRDG